MQSIEHKGESRNQKSLLESFESRLNEVDKSISIIVGDSLILSLNAENFDWGEIRS